MSSNNWMSWTKRDFEVTFAMCGAKKKIIEKIENCNKKNHRCEMSISWTVAVSLTWILCRAVEASVTLCGTSKHLAVLILALTNHCWKSLRAVRNLCSNKRSLFWHSLDARRLRLEGTREEKGTVLACLFTGLNEQRKKNGYNHVRGVGCLPPVCSSKQRGQTSRCSDTVKTGLKLQRRRSKGSRGERTTSEKQAGGEMAKWVKWKEWALRQRARAGGWC